MRNDLSIGQIIELAPYVDAFAGKIFNTQQGSEGYEVARRMFILGMLVLHGEPKNEADAITLNNEATQTLFHAAQKKGDLDRHAGKAIDFNVARWRETSRFIMERLVVPDGLNVDDPVAFVDAVYRQSITHRTSPDEAQGLAELPRL